MLVLVTLWTCPVSRAVRHYTQLFLLDKVQADRSVDIWNNNKGDDALFVKRSQRDGASRRIATIDVTE